MPASTVPNCECMAFFERTAIIIDIKCRQAKRRYHMSDRLTEDRNQIDAIDQEIAALFEKRFSVVKDIIDYKIENRLPILDSGREQEIIARNCERIEDDDIRYYFRKMYTAMIELSKEYQTDILNSK